MKTLLFPPALTRSYPKLLYRIFGASLDHFMERGATPGLFPWIFMYIFPEISLDIYAYFPDDAEDGFQSATEQGGERSRQYSAKLSCSLDRIQFFSQDILPSYHMHIVFKKLHGTKRLKMKKLADMFVAFCVYILLATN